MFANCGVNALQLVASLYAPSYFAAVEPAGLEIFIVQVLLIWQSFKAPLLVATQTPTPVADNVAVFLLSS